MDYGINFDYYEINFDYYKRIIDRNFLEIDIQLDNTSLIAKNILPELLRTELIRLAISSISLEFKELQISIHSFRYFFEKLIETI